MAAYTAIGLGFGALVFGIGGMWVWVIFDMAENVANAVAFTSAALGIAAFFMTMLAICMDD